MYTGTCLQIIQAGPVGQGGSSRGRRYGRLRDGSGRHGGIGTAHASCTEDTAGGTRTPLPRPFCKHLVKMK